MGSEHTTTLKYTLNCNSIETEALITEDYVKCRFNWSEEIMDTFKWMDLWFCFERPLMKCVNIFFVYALDCNLINEIKWTHSVVWKNTRVYAAWEQFEVDAHTNFIGKFLLKRYVKATHQRIHISTEVWWRWVFWVKWIFNNNFGCATCKSTHRCGEINPEQLISWINTIEKCEDSIRKYWK